MTRCVKTRGKYMMKNLIDQNWKSYTLHVKNSFNRTFEKAPAARDFILRNKFSFLSRYEKMSRN